jgi:hypothetical protein
MLVVIECIGDSASPFPPPSSTSNSPFLYGGSFPTLQQILGGCSNEAAFTWDAIWWLFFDLR